MINLSKREKYIFIATIIVIVSAVAYNIIFVPIGRDWDSLNNEIVVKRAKLTKAIRLLENQDEIIGDYTSYTVSLGNISKILSYIERQADSLGIETSNIKPRPIIKKELYKEYNIELQIRGTFSAINEFVSKLIKPPVFIAVKRFDLRAAREDPSRFKGTLILSHLII